jgi:hypothetical protein
MCDFLKLNLGSFCHFDDERVYQNKAAIYDLLFKAAAEATLTIAADPTT